MKTRKVNLTLENAIALNKLGGMGSIVAHAAFSKDELELNDLPKTYLKWESVSDGDKFIYDLKGGLANSSIEGELPLHLYFRSLDQISGIEALIKLENIASYYRKYHVENFLSPIPNECDDVYYINKSYIVTSTEPRFSVEKSSGKDEHTLWFPSELIAEIFLENFTSLILIAKRYIH